MTRIDQYRQELRATTDWDAFLLANSGLPGPRGNLELAQAVAAEGDAPLFERYLRYTPEVAPVNSPEEFLAFCGVLGLGKLVVQGQEFRLATLRAFASDPRWRTREAVAMALQMVGRANMPTLVHTMQGWAQGSPLEQRAAAAALCEPDLLADPDVCAEVLAVLDEITRAVAAADAETRRSAGFKALRKGLGYCWSVAVAASPVEGKGRMEIWLASEDNDVRWIMKENLKKQRLERMDVGWVAAWRQRLGQG
jgi:hypothetical protein